MRRRFIDTVSFAPSRLKCHNQNSENGQKKVKIIKNYQNDQKMSIHII